MIEVLLAAYNGEKYIEKQLESILNQTRQDIKVVIRDDNSSDDTVEVIKKYIERNNYQSKITLISDGKNSGSSKNNFIKLIKQSEAEYVMLSDQDDIWNEDKIERSMQLIEKAEKRYGKDCPILVHTDLAVMDEKGNIISDSLISYMNLPRKDSLKNLLLQNSVTGCTMLVNKTAINLLKMASEDGDFVIHDHFAAVLIALFGRVICLNESTMKYRQHSGNVIGASNANSIFYRLNRFITGKKKFRKDMDDCYRQARYIILNYADELEKAPIKKVELIKEYAGLLGKKSCDKRKFFRKNNMYKCGKLKKIMQILWC